MRNFTLPTFKLTRILRSIISICFFIFLTNAVWAQSIVTDKPDYAPGTIATFTGSGFQPGESVKMQVLHADGTPATGADHDPWFVTADVSGGFVTTWHVCEDDCVGSTLRATADGQSSGLHAEVLFTDGNFNVKTNNGTTTITASFYSNSANCSGTGILPYIQMSVPVAAEHL